MPYSTANGIKIYYEVSGEGLPFVLIHANPFDHNSWMYQIAHFSTYFKVIAIDIRGYGRSDKPTTPFSLKEMADDILGVCRDEGVKEAILAASASAQEWGFCSGWIIRRCFKPVILVGGNSGGAGSIEERIHGYTKIGIETYHISTVRGTRLLSIFLKQNWANIFSTLLSKEILGSAANPSGRFFAPVAETDMTSRLGSMKVPTLVINGEYDNSLAAGKKTVSLIPAPSTRFFPKPGTPAASKTRRF